MLSKDPQFRKLKIRGAGLIGSASYWLAPDHLLIVTIDGYTERYRRIYFRDIQAIIIRRTSTWIWLTVALSALTIVAGILPMSTGEIEGLISGGIMVAGFGSGLAFNLIAGPTCSCRIVTAVQNRDLPHINRWRKANRLLEALQNEISRVQRPTPAASPEVPVEPISTASDQATA
ncbi:hypothetical protein GC207_07805 [bacterium]|nr:hypothetical protein [bacterium]